MTTDKLAQHLHDRATRGEPLTPEERAALGAWYADQDRAELAGLQSITSVSSPKLQMELNQAIARIHTVSDHIQHLLSENAELQREVAGLHERLAKQPVGATS